MSFRQPFVYCCMCFARPSSSRGSPAFWLTSCAHIFCPQHASGFSVLKGTGSEQDCSTINVDSSTCAPIGGTNDVSNPTTQSCPFCNTPDVSAACLDSSLPPDLAIYFRPADDLMTDVMSVVKFQTRNLSYLAKHYESQSKRAKDLEDKVQSQQQVLENVRQELQAARKWKEQLDAVIAENTQLRAKLGLSLSGQDYQDAGVMMPSINTMAKATSTPNQFQPRISNYSNIPYPAIPASPALSRSSGISSSYRNRMNIAPPFRDVAGIRVGSVAGHRSAGGGGPLRNGSPRMYQRPGRISSVASPFFQHSTPRPNIPSHIPGHANGYDTNLLMASSRNEQDPRYHEHPPYSPGYSRSLSRMGPIPGHSFPRHL